MKLLESHITSANQLNAVFKCKHCDWKIVAQDYKDSHSPIKCINCGHIDVDDEEIILMTTQVCRCERDMEKLKYRCYMHRRDGITWELVTPAMCKYYEKWDGHEAVIDCCWKKSGYCTNKQAIAAVKRTIEKVKN
jgi:hypothetical protein